MGRKQSDETATQRTLLLYTQLLFTGERLWLPDLARQYNCAKGTIMRNIAAIEQIGIAEIATGMENGRRWYQLKYLPGTPYISLSRENVEALALCRDLLKRLLPEGVEKTIEQSIAKISTLMPKAELRAGATASKVGRVRWGGLISAGVQEHLDILNKARESQTVCELVYRDFRHRFPDRDREPAVYQFLPVRLMQEEDTLNMEGWLITGDDNHCAHALTVSLHRIVSCRATGLRLPDCPPLPEHKGVFGLIGFEPFRAVVSLSEEYADYIRERVWSEEQEIVDLPDGGVELHFWAADEDDLVRWVLNFGVCAELHEPQHLRQWLYDEVQVLCECYAPEEKDEQD